MKKKPNSLFLNDTVNKLSDDKRKKTSSAITKTNPGKNKTITDFIPLDRPSLPANSNKIPGKSKKVNGNNENFRKEGPSNLKKDKENVASKLEDKTIFNEEVIDQIHLFLSPFFEKLKTALELVVRKQFHFLSLNSEEINKFFSQNTNNFLVKFFLQIDKRFLYIPRTFEDEKCFEKEKIVLFEGFDDTKHISLKYDPIKCSEVRFFLS
jgi:hypothetical protein